jgi:hypothetical protein
MAGGIVDIDEPPFFIHPKGLVDGFIDGELGKPQGLFRPFTLADILEKTHQFHGPPIGIAHRPHVEVAVDDPAVLTAKLFFVNLPVLGDENLGKNLLAMTVIQIKGFADICPVDRFDHVPWRIVLEHARAGRIDAQQLAGETGAENPEGAIFINAAKVLLHALRRLGDFEGIACCRGNGIQLAVKTGAKRCQRRTFMLIPIVTFRILSHLGHLQGFTALLSDRIAVILQKRLQRPMVLFIAFKNQNCFHQLDPVSTVNTLPNGLP